MRSIDRKISLELSANPFYRLIFGIIPPNFNSQSQLLNSSNANRFGVNYYWICKIQRVHSKMNQLQSPKLDPNLPLSAVQSSPFDLMLQPTSMPSSHSSLITSIHLLQEPPPATPFYTTTECISHTAAMLSSSNHSHMFPSSSSSDKRICLAEMSSIPQQHSLIELGGGGAENLELTAQDIFSSKKNLYKFGR